jgi:tetratricopeptide (TPR) repeat protein
MGNLGEAATCYQRALSLHREAGDRFTQAEALAHLGETWQAVGKPTQARDAWEHALAIFDDLGNSDAADKVRAMLASADGRPPPNVPQPGESEPALPA